FDIRYRAFHTCRFLYHASTLHCLKSKLSLDSISSLHLLSNFNKKARILLSLFTNRVTCHRISVYSIRQVRTLRSDCMLHKINHRVKDIAVPGIRVFANRVAKYEDGINLTIGEPDFPTPESVKQAGKDAISNNLTGYSHNAGLFELRESVAAFFKDTYGFRYDPETEIVITVGVSEGIDAVLRTILAEGDEVIIPAPIYSAYEPIVHLLGAKVVYLDTSKTGFLPNPDELERLI